MSRLIAFCFSSDFINTYTIWNENGQRVAFFFFLLHGNKWVIFEMTPKRKPSSRLHSVPLWKCFENSCRPRGKLRVPDYADVGGAHLPPIFHAIEKKTNLVQSIVYCFRNKQNKKINNMVCCRKFTFRGGSSCRHRCSGRIAWHPCFVQPGAQWRSDRLSIVLRWSHVCSRQLV